MKTKLFVLVGVCLLIAGCSRTPQKKAIQINGSDTMVNLGQAWAEQFMKENKGASVSVTGGGSGTGIAALIDGRTDICEASRAMKPEEISAAEAKGVHPKETTVAWDGIAVVVNKANPVSKLTFAQLRDIFMGTVKNWKDVGGADEKIVILSREVSSGTHIYFKENILMRGDPKGKEEYADTAQFLNSTQDIVNQVQAVAGAVGYVGLGYISDKLKVVEVAKDEKSPFVAASVKAVLDNSYPISRKLFMYTNGEPKGEVKAFLDFVLSPDGQSVVAKLGFVPLTKK